MPVWLRLGNSKVVQISIIPRCLTINPFLAIYLQLSDLFSKTHQRPRNLGKLLTLQDFRALKAVLDNWHTGKATISYLRPSYSSWQLPLLLPLLLSCISLSLFTIRSLFCKSVTLVTKRQNLGEQPSKLDTDVRSPKQYSCLSMKSPSEALTAEPAFLR